MALLLVIFCKDSSSPSFDHYFHRKALYMSKLIGCADSLVFIKAKSLSPYQLQDCQTLSQFPCHQSLSHQSLCCRLDWLLTLIQHFVAENLSLSLNL